MKIGNIIQIKEGRVCTTFPLEDFKCYMLEERNNNMKSGTVIEAKNWVFDSYSVLVKDFETEEVCVVRTYDGEFIK